LAADAVRHCRRGARIDPVGSGFVASLARPGGHVTGFATLEGSLGGKIDRRQIVHYERFNKAPISAIPAIANRV
jgi:hypothetical protein